MSFKYINISCNKPVLFLSQYYFLANFGKLDKVNYLFYRSN